MFLADCLRPLPLRREIHEGLQVAEYWNSSGGYIFYGKGSELIEPDQDSQAHLVARPRTARGNGQILIVRSSSLNHDELVIR